MNIFSMMSSEVDSRLPPLSRVLFLSDSGEPMRFFLRPGPTKAQLQPIIRAGGGVVCRVQEPSTILLSDPEDMAEVPANAAHRYVSTQYVRDCVERNQQLEVEDYRFRGESEQTQYTAEEDAAILRYVRGRAQEVRGNCVWQRMEQEVVTSHSWQSMKDRYHKFLVKQQQEPLEEDGGGRERVGVKDGPLDNLFTKPMREKGKKQKRLQYAEDHKARSDNQPSLKHGGGSVMNIFSMMSSEVDDRLPPLSRVLFLSDSGEPMRFFLRPGPTKAQLQPIIRAGGGVVCRVQEPSTILLSDPEDMAEVPANAAHRYVSTQYVRDCVERNQQLEVEDYRFRGESERTRSAKRKREGSGGRVGYTAEEDAAILRYVRGRAQEVRGNCVWQRMEQEVVTSHSWQSMKDRYHKFLVKQQQEPLEEDGGGRERVGVKVGPLDNLFTKPMREKGRNGHFVVTEEVEKEEHISAQKKRKLGILERAVKEFKESDERPTRLSAQTLRRERFHRRNERYL
ncbi:hypothetical protein AAFF_G00344480 [Aldrovandia affinis]|uniref:Telomeric repeat-binding factor 2-interacting protein 1 n=1 Tax=Aldrovandia affinis TaxID=143900 RepID=A0AAD7WPD6_9TELE|nr:hypothetical protein AAFF_G00344480 [Aldrovandia affinis]